jgi:hypothetical protein
VDRGARRHQRLATGGRGGVHRGDLPDISADLPELARIPMVVVCSAPRSSSTCPPRANGWRRMELPWSATNAMICSLLLARQRSARRCARRYAGRGCGDCARAGSWLPGAVRVGPIPPKRKFQRSAYSPRWTGRSRRRRRRRSAGAR